jgi:uncharacterized protein (DUF58 family)
VLTPTGRGVLIGGLVLYAGGVWLGYPPATAVGFAGLLAVGGALAWALPRPRLSVERVVAPRKVARGDPAKATVTVTNHGRRVRAGLDATDVCGGEPVHFTIAALPAGGQRRVSYHLPTERRGELQVGPVRLVRADPLGLARRVQEYGEAQTLLVRPRTCFVPMLPAGRAHHLEGPTSATADDGTVTFHSLREYVTGDDLRRVHWRYTARTGTLMVRRMVDVSLPHTMVVLDARPAAYPPHADGSGAAADSPFELAVDVAASIALAAARNNFPVQVITPDGPLLASDKSGSATDALLDRLALLKTSAATSLAAAFDGLERVRGGGSLIVVTGHGDATGLARMSSSRYRFERAVLVRTGVRAGHDDRDGIGRLPVDAAQLQVGALEELPAAWRREVVK